MKKEKFYPNKIKKKDIENFEDWQLLIGACFLKGKEEIDFKNYEEEDIILLMDSFRCSNYEYFILEENEHNCICGYDKNKKCLIELKDKININIPTETLRTFGFLMKKDNITNYNWKDFIINYLEEKNQENTKASSSVLKNI